MSVTFNVAKVTTREDGTLLFSFHPNADTSLDLNLANGNAYLVLQTLGIEIGEDGLYGDCSPEDLLARCNRALGAIESRPSEFERSPSDVGGDGKARMIDFGYSSERVKGRVLQLRALAIDARKVGGVVSWA